jgi:hypothetical protein
MKYSHLSTKEASQKHSKDGVENHGTSNANDSLLPHRDVDIAISLYSEEVGVDAKDNSSAAELKGIQRRRAKL